MILLNILLATAIVGLISFVGLFFFLAKTNIQKITFYLLSLASGTLLGTAFLHLIPEAMEHNPSGWLVNVCLGVFLFFILEKFLVWRHCHLHQHPTDHHRPTAARMLIIGDAIHNLIDGVIIASAFQANYSLGVSVTAAIILHEIPQELGDFGILLHGGYPLKKALIANGLTATAAIVGALVSYFFIGTAPLVQAAVLPLAAGGFLYIALADLIPQLHEQTALRQTFAQIVLLLAGFALTFSFRHHAL